jgi:serine/threonine protein kinase
MQFRELTDRYQLQKIVKSTRFGTVLRATDTQTGGTVAVKLITLGNTVGNAVGNIVGNTVGDSPGLAAAPDFERLAAALTGLGHPNLPAVLDSGFTTDGSAFLVMELLEGRGLDSLTGAPPIRVLTLIGQTLNGLEALASRGLAHHNLSPDNVFLVSGGNVSGGDQVKLLGLGSPLFRPRGPAAAAGENSRFRAPELATEGPADGRADLFSLAMTACHALGATVGFGDTPVVQLPLAVSFELESDDALRQALERSLRNNPAERPTPAEIREALRRALGGAIAATATPPAPRPAAVPAPVPSVVAAPPLIQDMPALPTVSAPSPAMPMASVTSTAPVVSTAAAPELLSDPLPAEEPADGELLSAVDDEILNALLSVPAPPPRPVEPAGGARGATARVVPFQRGPKTPAAAAESAAPVAHQGGAHQGGLAALLRKPAVVGAIAGLLVLCGLTAFWLLKGSKTEAVAAPAVPNASLPKPPAEPPIARLEEAKLLFGQGDDRGARRVLRSIPFGEQGLLPPQGCRELGALEETLALRAFEHLASDLASGLKSCDMDVLQGAVETAAGQEPGLAPEVRAELDRARGAVEAYAQAWAASGRGEHAQVLERFAALTALLPKASDPDGLRDKAAQALETQADALAGEAKYAEALAKIGPVQKGWPDRPGLKERLARYQTWQHNQQEQETLLAALPGLERRKKPWEALQALEGVEPTPNLAPRFAEVRTRLENLLARVDGQPPQLVLRDGYYLEYARGTVVELSFRATDDYEIRGVKVLARPEGGKFRELPLEKTRTGYYTVTIDPGFHQNGTVDLYAVATDLSGHEGSLGSRDKPLQLKRKQGFERLIQ